MKSQDLIVYFEEKKNKRSNACIMTITFYFALFLPLIGTFAIFIEGFSLVWGWQKIKSIKNLRETI